MSLALLVPAALAALAAVLLPLAIHLARRSERRPTAFAALRWLRPAQKPRQRLRFDEWPLLGVRLLLLALLAALLARPVLSGADGGAPRLAVAPGVDAAQARAFPMPEGARRVWLAPGFPGLSGAAPPQGGPVPVSSLLRELDATLPADAALTVLVPAELGGLDARRVQLGRRVDWRVVPGATPAEGEAPPGGAPWVLTVRHAAGRERALRYLRAADAAWRTPAPPGAAAGDTRSRLDVAPQAGALAADARRLVWLAPGPLPAAVADWVARGGTALLDAEASVPQGMELTALWHDDAGAPLVEGAGLGRGRLMRLTRPLAPEAMPQLLEPRFPERLRALFEGPAVLPERALGADVAPTDDGPRFTPPPRELQPWLVLAVALAFVLERWLASGPRRGTAP